METNKISHKTIVTGLIAAFLFVFLFGDHPVSAAATPTFIQSNAVEVTTGTTVSSAFPAANTAGNLIVVFVMWSNTGNVSISDTRGNAYTSAVGPTIRPTNKNQQIFYAKNITGGANTVTATFATSVAGGSGILYIHEYSGIDTTSPVDVTAAASGTGSAMNSGSVNTTNATDLIFGGGGSDNNVTQIGAGFTSRSTFVGNITEDKNVTSTGSYSATATHDGTSWAMLMVAFKADANGTTPPPTPTPVPPPSPTPTGGTVTAATCSYADVSSAYNNAVSGNTIMVPAGNCTWGSALVGTKSNITFMGAGAGSTTIAITAGARGFRMQTNGWRVSGFTFDCNYSETSNAGGIVTIGSAAGAPTWEYKDWRIDHNNFVNCGALNGDTTGRPAISVTGFSYGVIDHNTFVDCNGECIDISQDGVRGINRSNEFGQYLNGTVFVEDNTFNATRAIVYENAIDGNSAQRFTFRHNTVNISNGARYGSAIVSTHETCVLSTGLSSTGDAGSLAYEMYDNTINLNSTGNMRDLGIVRGGRALIYNNHIIGTSMSSARYDVASWLSNYRSFRLYGSSPTYCGSAAHPRGYSGASHEADPGYISEGLDANKTTLSSAITSSQTTIPLTSVTGFSLNGVANGFSIKVDNEQIDYTGISGNQLTGVTRGANHTTAAVHNSGASVNYLKFGVALEQVNNVRIWNNDINGVVSTAMNNVIICAQWPGGGLQCAGEDNGGPDYTDYDIQSFAQRPNNWQYQTGIAYSYTPYTYPHPLVSGASATPIVGDINADHIVNSIDYSILNSHWFTNDSSSDLNHDGLVNAIDYSILNANWFKTW
jgi:hypothetical protein